MKKVLVLATSALLFTGMAFAHGGDKKCAQGKTCCKDSKECKKDMKKDEKKEVKTAKTTAKLTTKS